MPPEAPATVHFTVDRPDVVGPLAVFPLIADHGPTLPYFAFQEAVRRGATLTELDSGASVNDLLVRNPLDVPVLLYEGEEVLGAQQNRIFDTSVLVAPRSELRVPVSCVEAGRWDASRNGEAFAAAPQTANPRLRRMKNDQARERMQAGAAPRAVQQEVWREVAEAAGRHGVASATGAMHDVFEERRELLRAMTSRIEMYCSQVGALVAIGGRFVVLDHVSDVEAFATLHGPLLQGYALDALEAPEVDPPSIEDAREFLALLLRAPLHPEPAVGMGEGVRFDFGGLAGTGLACGEETVTLTAFANDPTSEPRGPATGRISRPSRRRGRQLGA
jgi:hypothetical protein